MIKNRLIGCISLGQFSFNSFHYFVLLSVFVPWWPLRHIGTKFHKYCSKFTYDNLKNTRLIVLLMMCIFSNTPSAYTQKLSDFINYDTITYTYSLDKIQTDFVVKNNVVRDSDILFTHPFKKFARNTFSDDSLKQGNYMIASIYNDQVTYRYLHKRSFIIKTKVINEDIIFFIQETKSKSNIENAKLTLDGIALTFSDGYGGYTINKRKVDASRAREGKVFLAVEWNKEYALLRYHFQAGLRADKSRPQYNSGVGSSYGYLITDKPLYKPGDTLNVKAYLINPLSGRPIRKRTKLYINEPSQQFNFSKVIKSTSRGAYLFKWKIPDTLKIDRNFSLNVQYQKRGITFQKFGNFYLEDYALNNNTYDVSMLNEVAYAGEDVRFAVSAKDANDFPLSGTLIEYKVSIQSVQDCLADSLTISSTKMQNLVTKDTVYSYEPYMEMSIPSATFPNINATYIVQIKFTDPNTFEQKIIQKAFTKYMVKEKILMYQQEDSIFFRCLNNNKDTTHSYTVIALSNNDTLFKKKMETPYRAKLSPYATRFIFIDKDSVSSVVDIVFNKLDIAHVKGLRKADSIQIQYTFPFDEPIYYRVLKNNKLVKEGKSRKLDFKIRDESKDSYTLQFTSNMNGSIESNFYSLTFTPQQHKIKLSSTIPSQAFPGQQIPITITATDYKDRPLKKVNLAAYAVNKKFEQRISTPKIDVPEKYKDLLRIEPTPIIDYVQVSQTPINTVHTLHSVHFKRFDLYKNEHYVLRYPKKEIAIVDKSIQSKIPEFAIMITHKSKVYTPKYILLDKTLVYISDLNKVAYSFPAKAGKHEITVRYFDKKIVLHDIQFDANKKYWIGLNIDSLKDNSKIMTITDSLPVAQPNEEEKEMMYSAILMTSPFTFDTLLIKSKGEYGICYQYYHSNAQRLNVYGDNFHVFGPLPSNGEATVIVNGKSHTLGTSAYIGHYYDALLKAFTTKKLGSLNGAIFSFLENNLESHQLAALSKPDTIKKEAEKVNVGFNDKAYKANTKEEERNYTQSFTHPNRQAKYVLIHVQNDHKEKYVKALWVMNNDKTEEADFISNINRTKGAVHHFYSSSNDYTLYFLMNNDQMFVVKNKLFVHGDHFYINPSKFKTEKISSDKLALPLKIYSDLTREALLPFYDEPAESTTAIIEKNNATRIQPYVHGMITTESLEPIPNANILVEINGKYKYGARTNNNGEFELLDLPAGSYMLRIFSHGYQMMQYNTRFFGNGKDYTVNASLRDLETSKPIYESLHQDFRFMAFGNKSQKNIIRISNFDKETRMPLSKASIRFYVQEKLIDTKYFNKHHELEIPTPLSSTIIYTLEIACEGYATMRITNVRFTSDLLFKLYFFLTKDQSKQKNEKKEYDLYKQNMNYPIEEEPVEPVKAKITYIPSKEGQVGEIFGRITSEQGKGLELATVTTSQLGIVKGSSKTDLYGNFKIKPLSAGVYDIKVSAIGYKESIVQNVNVTYDKRAQIDVQMQKRPNSANMKEVVIKEYKTKLIDASDPGSKIISSQINNTSHAPASINSYEGISDVISFNAGVVSGSTYMLDAVQTFRYSTLELASKYGAPKDMYVDDQMINDVSNMSNISSIRKKFSDVGYWQANHITNKKGIVQFNIDLPDNITSWKSMILAMGKRYLHGIDSVETKVFKPLQTQSIIPAFLWDNDKVYAKAKFSNLTKEAKTSTLSISVNNKILSIKEVSIKNDYVDSVLLAPNSTDSILWKASLFYKEKYKDEEEHAIPVYSSAMKFHTSQSLVLDEDSTYQMQMAKGIKGNIILHNTLHEKILTAIQELNQYEYGCVEQSASKLKAMLCRYKINKHLGEKINSTAPIYYLIQRLSNMQNPDGSWGWWKNEYANYDMTIYALDVLYQAQAAGFSNHAYETAQIFLNSSFNNLSVHQKIYAAYILSKMQVLDDNIKQTLASFRPESLNIIDKMYLMKMKENTGEATSPSDLYALLLEAKNSMGHVYTDNFFNDPHANLITAYQLFSNTSYGIEWVKLFRDKLKSGQLEKNMNTYSKALLIEALTKDIANTNNKPIASTVIINDTLKINKFPYRFPIRESKYQIKHVGGEVFMQSSEENWAFQPKVHDSLFQIATSFTQNNNTGDQLVVGKPCQLNITVDAYRSADYVMIEIPIPSGMAIINKPQTSLYSVEYYKHKIVIFYNKLSMDKHVFRFDFMPKLKGNFTLPAAKCSLMYYPFVYGNNETRTISIQ